MGCHPHALLSDEAVVAAAANATVRTPFLPAPNPSVVFRLFSYSLSPTSAPPIPTLSSLAHSLSIHLSSPSPLLSLQPLILSSLPNLVHLTPVAGIPPFPVLVLFHFCFPPPVPLFACKLALSLATAPLLPSLAPCLLPCIPSFLSHFRLLLVSSLIFNNRCRRRSNCGLVYPSSHNSWRTCWEGLGTTWRRCGQLPPILW